MADTDLPPRLSRLAFHGPLSGARADRMAHRLAERLAGTGPGTDPGTDPGCSTGTGPGSVLDIGCGWGELMLRVLERAPGATGVGIDLRADDLARGRDSAAARGLADRVTFERESARGTGRGPADLVLCLGAGQALADDGAADPAAAALRELRRLV
ncbi:MAG TPA: SAM-dependent methyltransferase, partial [Streptomyces sp.]|nr:SAM-dependent methyltransferase [Streptomyces sp.]